MLETNCVGDNFEILVTDLAVFATNILYLLTQASGTNIQRCHQYRNSVTNTRKLSQTYSLQHPRMHPLVNNIYVAVINISIMSSTSMDYMELGYF